MEEHTEQPIEKTRTVIFLDIDGVLQPTRRQNRFKHDMEQLREDLAAKYDNDAYLEMSQYDLAAVYYDWHKEAVERLRALIIEFDAEIVLSSAWREFNPLPTLQAYFRIHDLDQYLVDYTVQHSKAPFYRAGEVKQYVEEHPEIKRFVILDDRYGDEFKAVYPHQFVYTHDHITEEDYQRARQILAGTLFCYEIKEIEWAERYGYPVSEVDTHRILGRVGHTPHRAYVYPLYTPKGISVLQAHEFDYPFHNGIFVGQNSVTCAAPAGERRANFWFPVQDWNQVLETEENLPSFEWGHESEFENRGILHYEKAPKIEQLRTGFRFTYETTWHSADDEPMLDEVRTIDLYEGEEGIFCDVISRRIAAYGDLTFGRSRHAGIGVRLQPQLLYPFGGQIYTDPYRIGEFMRGSSAQHVANGHRRGFIAYHAKLSTLGEFGVFLSALENRVLENSVIEQTPLEELIRQERTGRRGWGQPLTQAPEHLDGPWFARDYGLAMLNPSMINSLSVEEGKSWVLGLRVVAYDGEMNEERAQALREL